MARLSICERLRIKEVRRLRPHLSVNSVAERFGVSWKTASRALKWNGETGARKQRDVSEHIVKRRKLVETLARKLCRRGNAEWPQFPSAASISERLFQDGIHASKSTIIRDLRQLAFSSRVRHHVPTRDPVVEGKRMAYCRRVRRQSLADVVWSDTPARRGSSTAASCKVGAVCRKATSTTCAEE